MLRLAQAQRDVRFAAEQIHLAILDLLGVAHGLVVLTKADLVDDEWLEMVSEEVRERLQGTSFADVPIVPVSARTGQGLNEQQTQVGGAERVPST